ncbi:sarcosine oxidase subunit gamma [Streptomyces sp. PTM05]|uniref:Sarcosine oxidase subunit gamma n=1 Tax=Streptantibioticus parmotrematis TaxID=2873249 RepID=A0ABS7QT44_9ACTN|nr:sarcosine oxidase subunit gamma family protein [Streptantibioticus parmotrematis]MBY8885555.1 sarcosine oxidase subunit gamma [Streptantibioticus parmotrematis]
MTADTEQPLAPVSPLVRYAGRFAAVTRASGGAVRLAELPLLAQLSVRLDAKGPAAEAVRFALGLALPVEPDTVAFSDELAALWLGPDEWLVVGRPGSAAGLEERLRAAVAGEHAAVTDVSGQRTTVLVGGARARDLLAHGCPLDLHPRAFGPGRCAQTTLARAGVLLAGRDEHRPGYWLLTRSSFAGYVADWLLDAATEYVADATSIT